MLRLAFIALGVIVVALVAVALLPEGERTIPESTIELADATVTLYPQADPEAVWNFAAPEVDYEPDTRQTTLLGIEDGERAVNDETDFTLAAEEVVIDSDDNLRSGKMFAHLVEEDWDLDMEGRDNQPVLINQAEGVFEIPRLLTSGDGSSGVNENMRISFDLTEFTSGGPGTIGKSTFEIGDPNGE